MPAGMPAYQLASPLTTRNVSSRSFSSSVAQPVARLATRTTANSARKAGERRRAASTGDMGNDSTGSGAAGAGVRPRGKARHG